MSASNNGFTIIELLIVITVTSILALGLGAATINYYTLITRNNTYIDMTAASQNLLRTTVDNLRYGGGVRQTNTITDPNAPAGGWNTSNSSFVIVIDTPATDSGHNFITDPDTGNPYMNELVYYKDGGSLMERSLANPDATGDTLVTSCPPAEASPSCPADKDLADNFSNMSFTLYDENAAVTSDPSQARSIDIALTMSRQLFGNPLTLSNDIRVTLRNIF